MNFFKAPNNLTDYGKYIDSVKLQKKFETRGIKNKQWDFPEDFKDYLKMKSSLNLGEFFKVYCSDFGFGYQKMFKLIKAHKKYLLSKGVVIIKQEGIKVNKISNKDNRLEVIMINKSKQDFLVEFLSNFK